VGAQRVIETLRHTGTPATFFLTGRFVRLYPVLARDVGRRRSFAVGNHTVDHADMTKLSDAQARWEIAVARTQILRATGRDPRPLFRFPYGAYSHRLQRIVRALGFEDVRWTVDTWGWMGAARQSAAGVVQRVVDHLVPGAIVLMHLGAARDGATLDSSALPEVIRAVSARGYRFVPLR
jgi:peptidoglycan/xylan/chitin deacetylase (PgdA/CDA1 family)